MSKDLSGKKDAPALSPIQTRMLGLVELRSQELYEPQLGFTPREIVQCTIPGRHSQALNGR